jgi:hemolysin activation/secretion protein
MKIKTAVTLFILSAFNINLFAAQSADEVQRNIDAYYQDRLRQFEIQNRTNLSTRSDNSQVKPKQNAQTSKRIFADIVVFNSQARGVSQIEINKIISKYKQVPMSMPEITELQNKIQKAFFDAGYASSRVYIDTSEFSKNVLAFQASQGYIEKLVFKRGNGKKYGALFQELQGFSFYPFAKDSLLNMRDLEQGLEQMNRLQTGNASLQIVPGTQDGYSIVEITNSAKNRFVVSLGADNAGTKSNGVYRANASVCADNLLMLNDNFSFNYSRNIDGNDKNKSSNSYFASLSLPLGYWTFMLSSFYSDYDVPAGLDVGSYKTDGATQNNGASLETVIKRSNSYKTSLGADIALKETINNFAGERIDASSRKLSVASAFLTHTQSFNAGSVYAKLSYFRGLDCFGALKNQSEHVPLGQFYSWSLYAQYSRNFKFPLTSFKLNYLLGANGQYSPDILYSSEQIAIGGQSSVRGFKEGGVSGDSGAYLRNNLSFNLSEIFKRNGYFNLLSATKINTFLDFGYARHLAYSKDYTLGGAGAGISYNSKYFNASATWSKSVFNNAGLEYEGNVFYLSLEGKVYF